ncbi:MAG: DUF1515 domain-containing protein [Elusimicrobiaceae bacterium]|nr:DUF1515 domain-containing protein [Elusimicrobiaceae bacterium]
MGEVVFSAVWKMIVLVFAAGTLWGELKAIRKDIARLEQKQDKYNHLQERVGKLEGEIQLCQHLAGRANLN